MAFKIILQSCLIFIWAILIFKSFKTRLTFEIKNQKDLSRQVFALVFNFCVGG